MGRQERGGKDTFLDGGQGGKLKWEQLGEIYWEDRADCRVSGSKTNELECVERREDGGAELACLRALHYRVVILENHTLAAAMLVLLALMGPGLWGATATGKSRP